MSLPRYPDGLPLGLKIGREYQTQQPFERTQRLKGMPRSRVWTTAPMVNARVEWRLTGDEAKLWQLWFHEGLNQGTAWFEIPLLYNNELEYRQCQFDAIYDGPIALDSPDLYSISATLTLRKVPLIDRDWLLMPDYWLDSGRKLFDLAMNREWPDR